MLKGMSTYIHIRERLHPGLLDGMVRGGAQLIEIFGARSHFDYTNPQHVREIGSWFRSTPGVEFYSMHSPMFSGAEWGRSGAPPLNIASRERKTLIDSMDEIKRAIEVAEQVPFLFLVQHVGTADETFDMHKLDSAITSIEHLRAFAKPLGVRLVVENIPNEMSTPEKLVELLQAGHFDDVGVCMDFGHAHLGEGVEQAFEILKPHLRTTHIHDNNKDRDAHLCPGEGTVDWAQAMNLLRTAPQVPPVLLELDGDPEGNPDFRHKVPGLMEKAWEKLNP
jgi:hypothetical protein